MYDAIILVASMGAGALGALVGIGGGIVIVPLLTVGLGLDVRDAVAVSLVAVVATSVSASVPHLRSGLANLKLGTVLELPASLGALFGYGLSRLLDPRIISLLFGTVLLLTALLSLIKKSSSTIPVVESHPWSKPLHLSPSRSFGLPDQEKWLPGDYGVARIPQGMLVMMGAGALSSLLGIGAGVFKVLAMDRLMGVPFRPSSATSSLMMGTTASVGAIAYVVGGHLRLDIVVPVVVGIVLGARYGAKLLVPLPLFATRTLFWMVLVAAALRMLSKGFGG